jgi:MraZ protein
VEGKTALFHGRFDHSIDEKGRVSIPVRFREVLESAGQQVLYITNCNFDGERCLELYPPSQWERLIGNVRQKGAFNPEVRAFQTFYIGGAHEVEVDKQGRVLIPPRLREYAALQREVTFSAMADHFQLWDRQAMDRRVKSIEPQFADPRFWEKLGL